MSAQRFAVSSAQPRAPDARMATGNDGVSFPELDGSSARIGIIKARWHEDICDDLVSGIKQSLAECGVPEDNIVESEVPGSFELPLAARYLALSGTVDAILPIGVLIKGIASLPRVAIISAFFAAAAFFSHKSTSA
eukprot:3973048-Pleurochrysis_carterae.AAC.4